MEPEVKDIGEILVHRDKLYSDQTKVIFERLGPVLDGIREYLVFADPSYTPGIFIWVESNMFDGGDLLMLVGRVEYEVGASFILEGEMIEITEQNKPYFVRTLRIGLPLSIVNQLDSSVTFDFLQTLRAAVEEEAAQMVEEAQMVFDQEQPSSNQYEFNLDDLTEEQRKALLVTDDKEKMN